jgi:ubiquinone/menaquinone biosynthesis C-methylase UbiE
VLVSDEHRDFWTRVAPKYDGVVDLQIGGSTRSLLRERLAKEGGLGALVGLGCGTGFYTSVLAEKADAVTATDLSPGMLALARDRITAPNVTFRLEDCQRTSFPDGAFDAAFLSLVIQFTEPEATLAEIRRVLRPGGTLIILNLVMPALRGLDRVRSLARVVYRGATGYRVKPPKRFGASVMTENISQEAPPSRGRPAVSEPPGDGVRGRLVKCDERNRGGPGATGQCSGASDQACGTGWPPPAPIRSCASQESATSASLCLLRCGPRRAIRTADRDNRQSLQPRYRPSSRGRRRAR